MELQGCCNPLLLHALEQYVAGCRSHQSRIKENRLYARRTATGTQKKHGRYAHAFYD
jgi:hypothetical protein